MENKYTEKMAKRFYVTQNVAFGCLIAITVFLLIGLVFICGIVGSFSGK